MLFSEDTTPEISKLSLSTDNNNGSILSPFHTSAFPLSQVTIRKNFQSSLIYLNSSVLDIVSRFIRAKFDNDFNAKNLLIVEWNITGATVRSLNLLHASFKCLPLFTCM